MKDLKLVKLKLKPSRSCELQESSFGVANINVFPEETVYYFYEN